MVRPTHPQDDPADESHELGGDAVSKRPLAILTALQPLHLTLGASRAGLYDVSVSRREVELGSLRVRVKRSNDATDMQLTLPRSSAADGVLRVTVQQSYRLPIPAHPESITETQP